jgi:predicted flap endonuclease-1-like 5' DNA nuclease
MDRIQIGPAGGNGGKPFDHYDIPPNARLTAVHLYTEWVVNALQIDFASADGQPDGRSPVGGLGGEHHVFYLDEDEYLTGISGRAGWYIDSLRLHTNKRVSPRYGGTGGERDFTFDAPAGYEISGFFGRSAWYLDALGVNARRRSSSPVAEGTAEGVKETESWMAPVDEGRPLAATVIVRRAPVSSPEEVEALEEEALAEAIAEIEMEDEGANEGSVDAAVYTQVAGDEESGPTAAVVMAVAAKAGDTAPGNGSGIETVGDEPNEVAVMVTDAIASEDDLDELEEEAVEGAIDTLLANTEGEVDEVEVTIYAGMTDSDEAGVTYAAVVAVATPIGASTSVGSSRAMTAASQHEPRPKDLELVEGIGPKIAALLIENGIYDLADLAATPVERLREILRGAGRRFRLADPGSWPEQAGLGADGQWDDLTELKSRLRAGR